MPSQQASNKPSQQAITRSHQNAITRSHHNKPSHQRLHSNALTAAPSSGKAATHATPVSMSCLTSRSMNETGSITHSGPMTFTLPGGEEARRAQVERVLVPVVAEDGVSRILTRVDPCDHL